MAKYICRAMSIQHNGGDDAPGGVTILRGEEVDPKIVGEEVFAGWLAEKVVERLEEPEPARAPKAAQKAKE